MIRTVAATIAFLALVTPSLAVSPQQQYEAGKKKYFTHPGTKPKAYCVCFSDDANNGRIGALREFIPGEAICYFPSFNPDGSYFGETPCSGTFTVVAK